MKESVLSLKEKTLVFLYLNCTKYLKSCMTKLLNIIFDDFCILLLGYRIFFSCLYIPQGLLFHKYFVTMKYR